MSTYWLNNSVSYDYSIMKQDTLKGLNYVILP